MHAHVHTQILTHMCTHTHTYTHHGEVAKYENHHSDSKDLLQVELPWSEQELQDLVVNIGVGWIAGSGEGGRG